MEKRLFKNRKGQSRFFVKNKKGQSRFLPKGKKGMELELLAKMLIAIAITVILLGAAIYLKAKGINILDYIKYLVKFGRR